MSDIDLLTVAECAPLVKMRKAALYRACREGQFPHVRIGKHIRIPQRVVADWIDSQIASVTTATNETAPASAGAASITASATPDHARYGGRRTRN